MAAYRVEPLLTVTGTGATSRGWTARKGQGNGIPTGLPPAALVHEQQQARHCISRAGWSMPKCAASKAITTSRDRSHRWIRYAAVASPASRSPLRNAHTAGVTCAAVTLFCSLPGPGLEDSRYNPRGMLPCLCLHKACFCNQLETVDLPWLPGAVCADAARRLPGASGGAHESCIHEMMDVKILQYIDWNCLLCRSDLQNIKVVGLRFTRKNEWAKAGRRAGKVPGQGGHGGRPLTQQRKCHALYRIR